MCVETVEAKIVLSDAPWKLPLACSVVGCTYSLCFQNIVSSIPENSSKNKTAYISYGSEKGMNEIWRNNIKKKKDRGKVGLQKREGKRRTEK